MKVLLLSPLLIVLLLTFGCSHTEGSLNNRSVDAETKSSFRAMTFNIRNDNASDGENAWPHRKEMVAGMIRFHGVDIVGGQEALYILPENLDLHLYECSRIVVGSDAVGWGE